MNNKKYMAFFVLLFIALLSCAVISAADTADNTTTEKVASKDTTTQKAVQTDNSAKSISDEKTNKIVKNTKDSKKEAKQEVVANSYYDLYDYVNRAKTSDDEYVIKLTGTDPVLYEIDSYITWDPQTPKTLTINGNGKTIDGAGFSRFLTITAGNTVIIDGLTVKNTVSSSANPQGSAITNYGTLKVTNSTFKDNKAFDYGAAIYSTGTLNVVNCTFIGNNVTNNTKSGSLDHGGAAIFSKGVLYVNDSLFKDNYVVHVDREPGGDGGVAGAISVVGSTGDVTIGNSTFINNTARHGGAVTLQSTTGTNLIIGNNFENNSALYGGALDLYVPTTVENNIFTNNTVIGNGSANRNPMGGAICVNCKNGQVSIKNNTFKENEAVGGRAGAVHLDVGADVASSDNTYEGNKAARGGVFFNNQASITSTDDEMIIDKSDDIDGYLIYTNSTTDKTGNSAFTGSTITSSKPLADLISNSEGSDFIATDMTINGMNIDDTDATTYIKINVTDYRELKNLVNAYKTNGVTYDLIANLNGTEYTETETIVIDDTFSPASFIIEGNAKTIDAFGKQFLTIAQGKEVTIKNLTVKNANAVNGSAVCNNGTLTVENSVFKDNTASYYGGAIYSHKEVGAQLTVINTEFIDNKANVGGAIFANLGSTLAVEGCNFTGNKAVVGRTTGDAGAIYVNNATVYINNTNFRSNSAENISGAIGITNTTRVLVNNTNFTANTAIFGGAAYTNATILFENSIFDANTATGDGAGIYANYGIVTLSNATFNNNKAANYGGAVDNAEATLYVLNSNFTENEAKSGGALYNTFRGFDPVATVTVINSSFTSNKATSEGEYDINDGGSIWTNLPLTVKGSNFTENSAKEGAAIYTGFAFDAYNINVDESKFTSNTASEKGGAIYTSYITDITNSNFKSNTAPDGSAIYVNPDIMSVMHEDQIYAVVSIETSTFESNVASENGTLYVADETQLNAKDSTFTDNQATNGSVVYQSGSTTLDTCTIKDNPVSEGGYLIANNEATSLTLKDNIITHEGVDLVNADVQTKSSEGNQYSAGNVAVEVSPIDDVSVAETEENINVPISLSVDDIYGVTSLTDAKVRVTVNSDTENPYTFDITDTNESTIIIPVSDLADENNAIVEIVSDSGIYSTSVPVSFNIKKLYVAQLTVDAVNIYTGDKVNITGKLVKNDVGIASKTIIVTIDGNDYEEVTDENGYYGFTGVTLTEAAAEVVVTVKFADSDYAEVNNITDFAVLTRPAIIPTEITVDEIPASLQVNDNITLSVDVIDNNIPSRSVNEGYVIFKINGKTLRDNAGKVIYVQIVNGKAELRDVAVTQDWAKEDSKIQAYYIGTEDYDISVSANVPVNVVKNTAVVSVEATSGVAGQNITIKATVTSNGAPIHVGRVAIKIDGKTLKDSNGKALYVPVEQIAQGVTYTLPAKIKAGEHKITVVFSDPTFDRATGSATLTVSK